jgi:hypothetical protein
MKNFLLTVLFSVLLSTLLKAQTQGPLNGAAFSVINIAGSSRTWINPSNVAGSDNSYASFGNLTNTAGAYTDYLVTCKFGLSIPSNAIISGIVVEVERSDASSKTSDYSVRIVKNGAVGTAEYSKVGVYPTSDATQTYGGATDKWGETWTPADINSPTFGIAIAAQRSSTSGTTAGRIDNIRISVSYNFLTLPVDLISFSGVKKNNVVQISWVTANEENMSYYEVERSADGASYSTISRVNSQNRAFTTTWTINDEKPLSAKSWYRLKMVEKSGVNKYSNIITISPDAETNNTGLYPNPLPRTGVLQTKNTNNQPLTVSFFSAYGHHLADVSTTSSVVVLDERVKANAGMLYYKISNKQGEVVATGKILLID